MGRRALSDRVTRRSGMNRPGCLIAFGSVFALVGLAVLVFGVVVPAVRGAASEGWVETPCEVLESRVEVRHGDDSVSYVPLVLYRWEAGGVSHQGDRVAFRGLSNRSRAEAQAAVDRYPAGEPARCFVDPGDPSDAVLEPGAPELSWWVLFPLPFLGFGVVIVWAGVRRARGLPTSRSETPRVDLGKGISSSVRGVPMETEDPAFASWRDEEPDEEVELGVDSTRRRNLLVAAGIALFWNGIVGIFVGFLLQDFQWFLALFLTPFVLVGLGLIVWVGYAALAAFNPRPRVRIRPRHLRLGETAEIELSLEGRAERVLLLEARLEGMERAQYRRGTDTVTDEKVFHRELLFSTTRSRDLLGATFALTVPADSMHSFESEHNSVRWRLVVKGDVPRWPDIDDAFTLRVGPRPC